MVSTRAVVGAAALLGVIYLTKPTKGSFNRAFRGWLRRRQGVMAEAMLRGAMALDSLAGPDDAFQDFRLFVVVQLKPGPDGDDSVMSAFFEDDAYFAAVGLVGHWVGVRVPKRPAGSAAPKVFYIGSALD